MLIDRHRLADHVIAKVLAQPFSRIEIDSAADDFSKFITVHEDLDSGMRVRREFRQHVNIASFWIRVVSQNRSKQAQFANPSLAAKRRETFVIQSNREFNDTHGFGFPTGDQADGFGTSLTTNWLSDKPECQSDADTPHSYASLIRREPIQLEGQERQTLVVVAFVEQTDAAVFQAGEAAIARRAGVDQLAGGPGAALVVADANGHPFALRGAVGIREQQRAAL